MEEIERETNQKTQKTESAGALGNFELCRIKTDKSPGWSSPPSVCNSSAGSRSLCDTVDGLCQAAQLQVGTSLSECRRSGGETSGERSDKTLAYLLLREMYPEKVSN